MRNDRGVHPARFNRVPCTASFTCRPHGTILGTPPSSGANKMYHFQRPSQERRSEAISHLELVPRRRGVVADVIEAGEVLLVGEIVGVRAHPDVIVDVPFREGIQHGITVLAYLSTRRRVGI